MYLAAWFLVVLALAAGPARAADSRPRIAQARLGGQEYLPLAEWARANGLQVRWLKRDEALQLNGRGQVVELTIDSRESQVNGVAVWLSFPVLERGDTAYLARLDAESTLRPVLFPTTTKARARLASICLDPGHGGKDPGLCVGPNQEKKYTLLLAKELRQQLERSGIATTLTRTSDVFVDLEARPELAARRHADLFVSLHFNAAEIGRQTVQGAQVFCLTPPGASSTNARGESGGGAGWFVGNRNNDQNLLLAYQLQRALLRELGVQDRGVRRARFAVLREATMPAVLIEAGFMSHPVEGRKIFTAAYRQRLARAILHGILAYKHALEPGPAEAPH